MKKLQARIKDKSAVCGIVGLGYVGLPLALAVVRAGFKTIGFDISKERVQLLNEGKSYVEDVTDDELKDAQSSRRFRATAVFSQIRRVDCIIICVPTPLGKTKEPDLSYILSAVKRISKFLKKEQLIVLESTTYPGTTEEVIAPLIEARSGLKVGRDVFLGFSPERVDPANKQYAITEIPKVTSGVDRASGKFVQKFYGSVFGKVVPVKSSRTAEMVKLLENTFRSVNIGLINEMAMICHTLKIDVWEVIEAAKTKPFGYMPFYPGPGIGGHCISIDPMYLSWKVRLHGYEPRMIETAQMINDQMPRVVIERIVQILNTKGKAVHGTNILLVGMAYKKNVSDTRESPSIAVLHRLVELGARVSYFDPFVPKITAAGKTRQSVKGINSGIKNYSMIVILTDHDGVDYGSVVKGRVSVLDARNALKSYQGKTWIHKL